MVVLRIEHRVMDFDRWKEAFDSDPAGREKSGVRRYRVMRSVDEPDYVLIDLEFDTREQAEGLLNNMRQLWSRVQGKIMVDPHVRIADVVEESSL